MDTENTPQEPLAEETGAQSEQVVEPEESTDSPAAAAETEEKIYAGKYRSVDELERAYVESQSKMTLLAQEKANLERMRRQEPVNEATAEDIPQLDPTVVPALDSWLSNRFEDMYARRREIDKAKEFEKTHADDLKDPFVRARTRDLIIEANAKGEYVDQTEALQKAKKELEQRYTPQVKEAKEKGFQEGHELAKAKTQAGAVGESKHREKIDPSKLSAAEFAEYYNIPRT